ncbi:hypothetical protein [Haemophilus influenzae]|uniref:hypothetical protein n=1 Tax=Haemophilus influenzae TaxID=727 RepID=UPI000D4050C6|nr:hypothetical protein [Haemophilus influenzae]PRJ52368.1 hypothetical protein BV094_00990 [Haemophilus influenzae]
MSILGSYLILNDKNIQKLQNEFDFGIDEIFHYSKNNALDLFIRIEKIESKKVKTEFNSDFELCGFVNRKKKDRFYNDFFKVADYNIDLQIDDEKDDVPFGCVYGLSDYDEQAKGKLSMIQFDGFIQIPSRTINETAQKIILDKFSSYRFLNNEFGDLNYNFGLNFDFPNNYLEVPTQYTYVLIEQLEEIIDFHQDEQLKKQPNNSIDSTELQEEKAKNTQLQAENERLKVELKTQQDRMAELEQKLQQSAVDSDDFSIYGHKSELLEILFKVTAEFWADTEIPPKNSMIEQWIETNYPIKNYPYVSKAVRQYIATILRPQPKLK